MRNVTFLITLLITITLSSCARKIREVKYNAYEMVGLEKRDLFKSEVKNVQEEQEETGEAFKDALTKLKEMYEFEGGDLERQHTKLKSSYESARAEAGDLRKRIKNVNEVAGDLFDEWEDELDEISTKSLRKKSEKQLDKTKDRFKELQKQMAVAEKKMEPVLIKLKDQVLFLKHNLNAKAIAGLKSESGQIQTEIKSLIKEVEEASKEAESFIETL